MNSLGSTQGQAGCRPRTRHRYEIDLCGARRENAQLWDVDGKRYIDLGGRHRGEQHGPSPSAHHEGGGRAGGTFPPTPCFHVAPL